MKAVETKRESVFGTATDKHILERINQHYAKYCADGGEVRDVLDQCEKLESALNNRIENSSADLIRHIAIQGIAELKLKQQIEAVRDAKVKLADAVEPLIEEKLAVLESAAAFVEKIGEQAEVKCPACGQTVPVDAFQFHVAAESKRLQMTISNFESLKATIATLCDTLKAIKLNFGKTEVNPWRHATQTFVQLSRLRPNPVVENQASDSNSPTMTSSFSSLSSTCA